MGADIGQRVRRIVGCAIAAFASYQRPIFERRFRDLANRLQPQLRDGERVRSGMEPIANKSHVIAERLLSISIAEITKSGQQVSKRWFRVAIDNT